MKNILHKGKKTYSISHQVVAVLALFSTVLSLVPSTANAGFKDMLLSLSLPGPFGQEVQAEEVAETVVEATFPVAEDRPPVRTLTVIATAYSSDPNQTDSTPCSPAMWKYDLCEQYLVYGQENTIAANFLPLGTKVKFPELYGDKVFVVRDRMNSRYNYEKIGYYRIDFYKAAATEEGTMDNPTAKKKAIDFGIKRGLKMEVLAYVK